MVKDQGWIGSDVDAIGGYFVREEYLGYTYLYVGAHANGIYRALAEGDVTSVWVAEEVIAR